MAEKQLKLGIIGIGVGAAESLWADPDIDVVWVSTPNRFHGPMTMLAAHHGKHVVVEKPMALNMKEAESMVEACEKHGVQLVAGHTQSFTPPMRYMRQVVRSCPVTIVEDVAVEPAKV